MPCTYVNLNLMRPLSHEMEIPSIVGHLESILQSTIESELVEFAFCKEMRESSRCFLINVSVLDVGAAPNYTVPVLKYDVVSAPLLMFCA